MVGAVLRPRRHAPVLLTAIFSAMTARCTGTHDASERDAEAEDAGASRAEASVLSGADVASDRDVAAPVPSPDAASPPIDASSGGGADAASMAPSCTTRITYGSTWIHPSNHPDPTDTVDGPVTWDGVCTDEGPNSFALLSNGWKPYFSGNGACMMALDGDCASPPAGCRTRVDYGSAWLVAPNHPARYDDVPGRLTWDGVCRADGANSFALLSNGWAPHFAGASSCELSFEYEACGGLYQNPVVDTDCPDPGVLFDGGRYYMTCTSGNAPDAFPIRVSIDLVHWTRMGSVFPSGHRPAWATGDFWAPEIHRVQNAYVVYFTARAQDGRLSIGAASASSPLGPFADIGAPLIHDPSMGLIDATEFESSDGTRYVYWKEDGNAQGRPTPIHGSRLAADGLSLQGPTPILITNDQPWEGALVEAPWMLAHGGEYFLFYSANAYYDGRYAVGVARAPSPLGPFSKVPSPILATGPAWIGPGHCSVLPTPDAETVMIYHAWKPGHVNGPGDGRVALVDRIVWGSDGTPALPGAPSARSTPVP